MLFGKKNKEKMKCPSCSSSLEKKFNYCPYCGLSLLDPEKEMRDFGMLGRKDFADRTSRDTLLAQSASPGFGITDKIINSIINNLMKNLDKQFNQMSNKDFGGFPTDIKIKIAPLGTEKKPKKEHEHKRTGITEEQLERMSSLPRETAKSTIKRLSNKVVCELNASGIKSPNDIFVSKLENGYEIKAIGNKKVYTNSIPVNLPLKSLSIDENKIYIEFNTAEE